MKWRKNFIRKAFAAGQRFFDGIYLSLYSQNVLAWIWDILTVMWRATSQNSEPLFPRRSTFSYVLQRRITLPYFSTLGSVRLYCVQTAKFRRFPKGRVNGDLLEGLPLEHFHSRDSDMNRLASMWYLERWGLDGLEMAEGASSFKLCGDA